MALLINTKLELLLKNLYNNKVWTILTYSHVSIKNFIRTLIVIETINKLEIHQMNVKIAFLNDDFEDEVYMEQHEGFVVNG